MKIVQRAVCLGVAIALNCTAFAGLSAALTHPAEAAGGSMQTIDLLARASGLTERQVRMVLGNPTAYAEYQSSYSQVDRRFRKAIGEQAYRDLKENRQLSARDAQHLFALVQARDAEQVASASK